jgi:FMN-dependent NADH-azoreductase
MSTTLVLTASPRGDRSVSRSLTMGFARELAQRHPEDTLFLRDIGHQPVSHVTEPWVIGAFAGADAQTPESKAAIAVSDQLIDEFLSADRYVFGVPMYNFHIPSTFKAYIDQIVRAGKTFALGPNGYEGLVKGKKALFITSRGQTYPVGSPMAAFNFQEPYLRHIFAFMGVTDVQFIAADRLSQGEDAERQSREKAENELRELAESW